MDILWTLYGPLWPPYGLPMDPIWSLDGPLMDPLWTPYGTPMAPLLQATRGKSQTMGGVGP